MSSIAHMLTRIRNAHMAKHESVEFPFSKLTYALSEILKEQRFIQDVSQAQKHGKKYINIELRYDEKIPAIQGLRLISKPSQRIYAGKNKLYKERKKMGTLIVSTPK